MVTKGTNRRILGSICAEHELKKKCVSLCYYGIICGKIYEGNNQGWVILKRKDGWE